MTGDYERSISVVTGISTHTNSVATHIDRPAKFGKAEDKDVWLLEPAEPLRNIHRAVRHGISPFTKIFYKDQWVASGYNPHISPEPGHPELHVGQEFLVDSLVFMLRFGDTKVVGQRVGLLGSQ
jgi:hypothetical protein